MDINISDININEWKDKEIMNQRKATFGGIVCNQQRVVGDGMIFDPETGSVRGINI